MRVNSGCANADGAVSAKFPVIGDPTEVVAPPIQSGYKRLYRRVFPAFATASAMKRGSAKAAAWTSGVQYLVEKPPALR